MQNIGVQSWCFREFKPVASLIGKLKECQFSSVELCGLHADFRKSESVDAIRMFTEEGIAITSIGVENFQGKAEEETIFQFAKEAGCQYIAADFCIDNHLDALKKTDDLANKYNINLGIHNHGGTHWLGSSLALNYVFKQTSPRIGLCLDTAWAMAAGEDPLDMARSFQERLYGLHLKDFVFDRRGVPEDVVLGTGALELPAFLDFLASIKYEGPMTIEYEGEAENPSASLIKCVEQVTCTW